MGSFSIWHWLIVLVVVALLFGGRGKLSGIMGEAAKILKPKGRCYLVYRPFRLAELFMEMKSVGIEPKKMRLVHPFMDKEPNMVLVEGIRGANPRLTVEKPLIVYESEGKYTKEILDIYGF